MDMKMKSIAFVIAYFGQLRNDFDLWLYSCAKNPTIDWILFTDCQLRNVPCNVKVNYTTFDLFRERIQQLFDFTISLRSPRKLCDFKVVYGELLEENELNGYDFWGYCDLDQIWGDVRTFLSESLLDCYDKIGFTGNCTLYRNNKENNRRYRLENSIGTVLYKTYFSSSEHYCFDEVGINDIYLHLGIPFYREVNNSNLAAYRHNFATCFLPQCDKKRNKHVVYLWKDGHLFHISVEGNTLMRKEIMFVHFLSSRILDIQITGRPDRFLIVPNVILPYYSLTVEFVKRKSKPYWMKYIWSQLKRQSGFLGKLSWIKHFIAYNYWLYFHGEIYNYWTWTKYEGDKTGRMHLLS